MVVEACALKTLIIMLVAKSFEPSKMIPRLSESTAGYGSDLWNSTRYGIGSKVNLVWSHKFGQKVVTDPDPSFRVKTMLLRPTV